MTTERAAGIVCRGARGFFSRRHADKHAAVVDDRGSRDACCAMFVEALLPPQLAGRGVDGVQGGAQITEVRVARPLLSVPIVMAARTPVSALNTHC